MKTIELLSKDTGGLGIGTKYYADNKQISRDQYTAIKNEAISNGVYGPASNYSECGVWKFYTTVRVSETFQY
jgi:hypothetical protein